MKTQVNRQTVDLSAFPDLVVIYLGMRARILGGIKTLLGFGPQIDKAGASRPDGLLHFENKIVFSFPRYILACAGTGRILNPWNDGRGRNRTAVGGKSSYVVRVELVSGTKRISYAAVWRLSMTM